MAHAHVDARVVRSKLVCGRGRREIGVRHPRRHGDSSGPAVALRGGGREDGHAPESSREMNPAVLLNRLEGPLCDLNRTGWLVGAPTLGWLEWRGRSYIADCLRGAIAG